MPDFWFFLTTTALFDSLSTALHILIFFYLLSAKRPWATAFSFLVAMSLTYLICGLVYLGNLESIHHLLSQLMGGKSVTDSQYYLLQGLLGACLIVGAFVFWVRSRLRNKPNIIHQMSLVLRLFHPISAGFLGVFFSVYGFPFSLPYLGTLENLARAYGPTGAIPGAVYYNLVYLLPILVPVAVYWIFRRGFQHLGAHLASHGQRWTPIANYGLTAVLGLLFVADSAAYYTTGHALLTNKFF